MLTTADYVIQAKAALGNVAMSDRQLGELLGYTTSAISTARYGNMSDPMALKIADVLKVEPGEVLMVARISREKDEQVKQALTSWASKTLAAMSLVAASSASAACGDVSAVVQPTTTGDAPRLCIMSTRRRSANEDSYKATEAA